ncbi:MAG: nitroreductase family protein [Flavobacteriales bacterium]|nr:MAG: nitroreductase family protein [Flavobacteriales bacterium]
MPVDIKGLKAAPTEHAVIPLIRQRFSARGFSDAPLTTDVLMTLFEAAAWAPSSMNEQPWRYRFALRGSQQFELLWSCLTAGNQPWTKNAGALVVCSGSTVLQRNGEPNHYWLHDVGSANSNLLLQAASMDIYGHLMGGFDRAKASELLGPVGGKEEIACFLALGYLGDPATLVEPFKTREHTPRARRALDQTVIAL